MPSNFFYCSLITIITHTPIVLEYRYLMVLYLVLLYFVFRINTVRKLIEDNFKKIFSIYGIFLILNLVIFAGSYPINVLKVYYFTAIGTSIILLFLVSMSLLNGDKIFSAGLHNDLLTIFIAFALAEASTILILYFWIVNMTYISPQQNFMIVPVIENINKLIFQNVI